MADCLCPWTMVALFRVKPAVVITCRSWCRGRRGRRRRGRSWGRSWRGPRTSSSSTSSRSRASKRSRSTRYSLYLMLTWAQAVRAQDQEHRRGTEAPGTVYIQCLLELKQYELKIKSIEEEQKHQVQFILNTGSIGAFKSFLKRKSMSKSTGYILYSYLFDFDKLDNYSSRVGLLRLEHFVAYLPQFF